MVGRECGGVTLLVSLWVLNVEVSQWGKFNGLQFQKETQTKDSGRLSLVPITCSSPTRDHRAAVIHRDMYVCQLDITTYMTVKANSCNTSQCTQLPKDHR